MLSSPSLVKTLTSSLVGPQDIYALHYDADTITGEAQADKANAEAELNSLTNIVSSFQHQISRVGDGKVDCMHKAISAFRTPNGLHI